MVLSGIIELLPVEGMLLDQLKDLHSPYSNSLGRFYSSVAPCVPTFSVYFVFLLEVLMQDGIRCMDCD